MLEENNGFVGLRLEQNVEDVVYKIALIKLLNIVIDVKIMRATHIVCVRLVTKVMVVWDIYYSDLVGRF